MGITEETVAVVLVKKRLHKKIPRSTLELYNEMSILIPLDTMESVVKSVA